ncbi:hypothetical protein PA598K_06674 [Paenibacillus sp. 598K]|nr:hypothetical protein PA598K_06674 [Paenibacillus sp. 598K]
MSPHKRTDSINTEIDTINSDKGINNNANGIRLVLIPMSSRVFLKLLTAKSFEMDEMKKYRANDSAKK